MFEILLIIILFLFILGYIMSVVANSESGMPPKSPKPTSPRVSVRGKPQDESNPREAVYARIRQRLKRPAQ